MNLPTAINDVIAYFFSEYPTNARPALLEDVVRAFLIQTQNAETADGLVRRFLPLVRETLLGEFNERFRSSYSIRFKLIDDEGHQIAGIGRLADRERLLFQNALHALTNAEFEGIAAVILKIAGCAPVFRTPESHDQGLDAFGYKSFLQKRKKAWIGAAPQIIFLAQAKHYSECRVGSKDIREFVGSFKLALHQLYSTVDERYEDLTIPPFSPVALIFLTTEEVPGTVKRLATRAGIIVLTSDDLFDLLFVPLKNKPTRITEKWLVAQLKPTFQPIPVAK